MTTSNKNHFGWIILRCAECGTKHFTYDKLNSVSNGCRYCGRNAAMEKLDDDEYEYDDTNWMKYEKGFMRFINNFYNRLNETIKAKKLGGRINTKIMKVFCDELHDLIEYRQTDGQ